MTDYRDPYYRDPNEPLESARMRNDEQANTGVGWIAGAVFLVVVLALIFGLGRTADRTAETGTTPPAATTGAAPPPPATAPRTTQGSGQ